MKFCTVIKILFFQLTSILICQETPDVDLSLMISDNFGNSKELRYGIDPSATDDIDVILGEVTLPPMPPSGNFEARFNLLPGDESTWKDYRQGVIPYSGVQSHYIQHQGGSGASSVSFEWDMPPKVTGLLQDMFGGILVNVSMSGIGSYLLTNLAVNPLKMIITYDGVVPVELSYFKAALCGNFVKLNWITTTEVSNYGFEIERKTSNAWQKIGFVEGNGNSNSPKSYSFTDENPLGGNLFQYRLKQIDNDGKFEYSEIVEVEIIPEKFALYQNYPNPFNPITTIRFQLPKQNKVLLRLYDILSEEVMTMLNEKKEAGIYEIILDARYLPSGTYIYRIVADQFIDSKKMVLLK